MKVLSKKQKLEDKKNARKAKAVAKKTGAAQKVKNIPEQSNVQV